MKKEDITNWQDQWEYEASKARDFFEKQTVKELLQNVKEDKVGSFYNIWDVIVKKHSPKNNSLQILWEYLRDHPGEKHTLHRYHCAAALFRILYGNKQHDDQELRTQVQWDHEGEEARQKALKKLHKKFPKKS